MNITPYLKRIGIDRINQTDLAELKKLQSQHMLHIPFENLDVMRGIPIPLDTDAFYEKVVHRHRGGFCYELNGLYDALLKQLGFLSQMVSATVYRPDGTWARTASHACIIVTLENGSYLTDVGFGDASRGPVPFDGTIHQDVSGSYLLAQVDRQNYDLKRKRDNDNWHTILRINMAPMKLKNFEDACRFNQTSPKSPFTQKELVTIGTTKGRITLSGNALTITENGEKKQTTIRDSQKPDLWKKYFQITDVAE